MWLRHQASCIRAYIVLRLELGILHLRVRVVTGPPFTTRKMQNTQLEMSVALPIQLVARDEPGGDANSGNYELVPMRGGSTIMALMCALRIDNVRKSDIVRMLDAFGNQDKIRVYVHAETMEIAACEVAFAQHRWIWLRSDMSRDLVSDLFN